MMRASNQTIVIGRCEERVVAIKLDCFAARRACASERVFVITSLA